MNSKHIILACLALMGAMQANAQGQDLSILTANADARTAAMGNAMVAAKGMHLYANPSAFLGDDKRFAADVSAATFEKEQGVEGTFSLYTASVGYKLASKHAVFAGFRYAGGLKFKGYDMQGLPTKDYKPYSWTIDLGYAYMLGGGFSAYAMGGMLFSHQSKNAVGASFTLGASYQNADLKVANKSASVMFDAKVGAIGPKLDFGSGNKNSLPTHAVLGATMTIDVSDKHQVATALSSRYYFLPEDSKTFMAGGGLEYTYNKLASVRVGYEYGDHNLSHVTMGAGIKYGSFRLNGAYLLRTADAGSSYFNVGIGYDF